MSMIGDRLKALEALEAQKSASEAAAETAAIKAEIKPIMLELGFTEKSIELGFTEKSIEIIKGLNLQETSFDLQNKDDRTLIDEINEILSVDEGRAFAALLEIIRCIDYNYSEIAKAKNPIEIEWQVLGLKQLAHEKMDEIIDRRVL